MIKNKKLLCLYNNFFSNVVFGFYEGLIVSVGLYIITVYILKSNQNNIYLEKAIKNSSLYYPFYVTKDDKENTIQNIDNLINNLIIGRDNDALLIKKNEKKLYKNYNIFLICLVTFICLLLIIVYIFVYRKMSKEKFFRKIFITSICGLVIVGAEIILVKEFVYKFLNVHIGSIIKKLINNLHNL